MTKVVEHQSILYLLMVKIRQLKGTKTDNVRMIFGLRRTFQSVFSQQAQRLRIYADFYVTTIILLLSENLYYSCNDIKIHERSS